MGGDLERLVADRDGREVDRGAGGHGLAAGEAALTVGNDRGIAGGDRDAVRRDVELLGADLRERGLDPLSHGHRAGVDGNAPGAADPHDAGFERAAAGSFHAIAEPDAEIATFGARVSLARGKAGIIDGVERHALTAEKVAAVESHRRAGPGLERRDIGHLFRRHEIAASNFRAIEAEFVRDAVKQALHRKCAFRVAGAAHRHGGDLVGLGHAHVELIGREHVGAGKRGGCVVRQVDALRRVGAFVVDHLAAHAQEATVVVEGDVEIPILVALLDRGEKMLAPVLDPLDRSSQEQGRRRQRDLFRVHDKLGAEAAADVGCDHTQLVLVEPQQHHQEGAHLMCELRRRP